MSTMPLAWLWGSRDEQHRVGIIPDVAAPYEQTWLGGEALETALSELAALEFAPAGEPDGGKMVSCLVIATNEEQITVHVDEAGTCWVWSEERGWRCGRGKAD